MDLARLEKRKMNDQEIRADLIEVRESGAFKTEHVFLFGGGTLGVLTLKAGKSEGSFSANDGLCYQYKKTSFWKSHYEWKQGERTLAKANSKGKLSRAFYIDYQGTYYGLFPGGSKLRSWKVKTASGRDLCEILPRGAFKRGAFLKILAEIPIELLVFCYCLVTRRWQEQSSG
jgi:hypothetical protein